MAPAAHTVSVELQALDGGLGQVHVQDADHSLYLLDLQLAWKHVDRVTTKKLHGALLASVLFAEKESVGHTAQQLFGKERRILCLLWLLGSLFDRLHQPIFGFDKGQS